MPADESVNIEEMEGCPTPVLTLKMYINREVVSPRNWI